MSKLSIIVTIYKDEQNILPFYKEFNHSIAPFLDDYEIIMVNDSSPDNAWSVMCKLADGDNHIKLVKLSRNFGAFEATYAGFQYATGDCVTVKAVDLQEPSKLTIDMYDQWKNGKKVVLAVREARHDSKINDFFSNLYYYIMRKMVQKEMPKGGFDIFLLDRVVIDQILMMEDKNSPLPLQLLWMGYEPIKIYYERRKREIGKSSWSFSKKMKFFMDSLIGFSYVPIRFMSMLGIVFLIFAFIWAVSLCIAYFNGEIPVQGYTTIIILVLFSSGLIMFTLGLLGEYIWRTLEASRNRPMAIVERTVNIEKVNDIKYKKN